MMNSMTWESKDESFVKKTGQMKQMFRMFSSDCERLLDNDEMLTKLKNENFDVIVIHVVDFCSHGMAEVLGIKGTIWMSSAFMPDPFAWYSGSTLNPSYIVSFSSFTDRMTFSERMQNALSTSMMHLISIYGINWTYDEIYRERFGQDFPSLDTLLFKTQLFFINADPFFEFPRPTTHNVIYVGGLTMKNAEPLTKVCIILIV